MNHGITFHPSQFLYVIAGRLSADACPQCNRGGNLKILSPAGIGVKYYPCKMKVYVLIYKHD